jgi:outer membrane receptor for ferric coprogen and ferric-rhodotorulic acid
MYLKTTKTFAKRLAILGTACVLALRLHGQSSTPPPAAPATTTTTTSSTTTTGGANSSTAAEDQNVTTLEKFTVSDVPIENQILPTVRPISSVYGDDRDIIDIPRSVSSVNKAWMDDRQVKNAMDFGQFAPGVYAAADYGIPGVPQIRGDEAQVYVNGQQIAYSRNSVPLSFNGVEAMDIVKGPGTAVFGPQGNGPGGYVNFVAKQPYFDMDHLDFSATLGTWTSGHSYGDPQYTLDFGGPINDKLAYRVSYLARYGDEYYVNAKDQTQDGYFALTYRMSRNVNFEFWTQGFATRTNEDTGANRVTQNFIWNGGYIAGPTIPAFTGVLAQYGYPYDVYLPSDGSPATNYPSGQDGAYQVVDPTKAHVVKLPAYDSLVGPNDTARSKFFQAQLKSTFTISSDAYVVNLAYWGLEHSNKFETYGYDEWVPRNLNLQDRTEFHDKFNLGPIENSIITGIDLKYQYVRSGDDYSSEPFSYYDLSLPLNNIFYPGYAIENNTWGSGLEVAAHPGYSYQEMQDSTIKDYAAFFQDDVKFTKSLSAILGFREDAINANTANPPLVQQGVNIDDDSSTIYGTIPYYNYYGYYSLPAPIYYDRGAIYQYHASKNDPSYFASIIYKVTETQSFYITYDEVDAIHGQTNFGGIYDGNKSAANVASDIDNRSTLYEAGYKGSFLNNTLYMGLSVYQQIKNEPQPPAPRATTQIPNTIIKSEGIEWDAVYQPTKHLSINANMTYQNVTDFGLFFEETGNYLDAYATTTPVDGTHGTGIGAVNYNAYQTVNPYYYTPPNGRIRAAGVPAVLGNLFVDYKLPYGFDIGGGPNFIGRQNQDDEGLLHIPSEYEVDAYIAYAPSKRWDARVNITNLTNNRILDPIDTSFAGNDVIYVRAPVSASITIRVHL